MTLPDPVPEPDPDADLLVSVDSGERVRWSPRHSPVRFGRARDIAIRLCRVEDTFISRSAGRLLFEDGLWWVRNDSESRAFSVVLDDGTTKPLATVCGVGSRFWAISPPGVTLVFPTPFGPIRVRVRTTRRPPILGSGGEDQSGDPTTPRHPLTENDRQLLAVKFLSQGATGPVLGDQDAAALCTRLGRTASAAAVSSAVARARERLVVVHGVRSLDGAQNIRRLRTELLAWAYLIEEDGLWMQRRRPDSHADDGPPTTG